MKNKTKLEIAGISQHFCSSIFYLFGRDKIQSSDSFKFSVVYHTIDNLLNHPPACAWYIPDSRYCNIWNILTISRYNCDIFRIVDIFYNVHQNIFYEEDVCMYDIPYQNTSGIYTLHSARIRWISYRYYNPHRSRHRILDIFWADDTLNFYIWCTFALARLGSHTQMFYPFWF